MSKQFCYKNGYRGTRPVLPWYQTFVDQGKAANYTSRRGASVVAKIITFTANGPKSFLNGRKFYFPDDFDINNSTIEAIELMDPDQCSINPTTPPTETNASQFSQGFLVICDECNNEILRMPLSMLNKAQNGGKLAFFNLKNLYINNSYIQFFGASGLDEDTSFYFNFYITKNN